MRVEANYDDPGKSRLHIELDQQSGANVIPHFVIFTLEEILDLAEQAKVIWDQIEARIGRPTAPQEDGDAS